MPPSTKLPTSLARACTFSPRRWRRSWRVDCSTTFLPTSSLPSPSSAKSGKAPSHQSPARAFSCKISCSSMPTGSPSSTSGGSPAERASSDLTSPATATLPDLPLPSSRPDLHPLFLLAPRLISRRLSAPPSKPFARTSRSRWTKTSRSTAPRRRGCRLQPQGQQQRRHSV